MFLEQEKKICSTHQMEITTVDLKQSTAKEDKYLCMKCLIEKIDIQNMVLVDETKIMIKEMKNEQQTLKIKQNQKRIETFKSIQCLIKEFRVQVENVIEKILIHINQKIQIIEKDLEELDKKSTIYKFEEEIETLSKIKEVLIMRFQQNLIIKKMIINSITLFNQCFNHLQTINQIIMLNLEPSQTQTSRLACVDCIHYNNPIKYTSLQDAGFKSDELKGNTQEKIKTFQNSRLEQQEQIIQNLKEMKEQYTQSNYYNLINLIKLIFMNLIRNRQINLL